MRTRVRNTPHSRVCGIVTPRNSCNPVRIAQNQTEPVVVKRPIQPEGLLLDERRGPGVSLAVLALGRAKGWVVKYVGPVLDELDAAVEGSAIDHVERDVGVTVVDAF